MYLEYSLEIRYDVGIQLWKECRAVVVCISEGQPGVCLIMEGGLAGQSMMVHGVMERRKSWTRRRDVNGIPLVLARTWIVEGRVCLVLDAAAYISIARTKRSRAREMMN